MRIPQNVGEKLQRLRALDLDSLSAAERAMLEAGMAALNVGALDAPAGGGEAAPLSEFLAADEGDALEALGDEIEMARLQALDPAAWADCVAAASSRCGLRRVGVSCWPPPADSPRGCSGCGLLHRIAVAVGQAIPS